MVSTGQIDGPIDSLFYQIASCSHSTDMLNGIPDILILLGRKRVELYSRIFASGPDCFGLLVDVHHVRYRPYGKNSIFGVMVSDELRRAPTSSGRVGKEALVRGLPSQSPIGTNPPQCHHLNSKKG